MTNIFSNVCSYRPGQSRLELFLFLGQLGAELSDLGLQFGDLVVYLSEVALEFASVLFQLLALLLLPAQAV